MAPARGSFYVLKTVLFLLVLHFSTGLARKHRGIPSHKSSPPRLQRIRAFNIAHRGANGEYPEETAPAYLRAILEGADFIETDITATKDGVLICMHDVYLNDTTNIADHTEFLDRLVTYEVDGLNVTGWFPVDFTWQELRTLRARQRFSYRDQSYNDKFPIITFEEYISIALNAPRIVGIYPEIKSPAFINQHVKWPGGKRFGDVFVETLLEHGYEGEFLSEQWHLRRLPPSST